MSLIDEAFSDIERIVRMLKHFKNKDFDVDSWALLQVKGPGGLDPWEGQSKPEQ